ncbi:hypothetical protein [Ornithinibacillus bavariensis]|uniref:hypothetical protein n=1 Tax=Ornithinibacillus bavariensis TaxID=545502 RepID=UPI000EEAEE13|nr:hypothetical protein [Ornithinibacillus sp.]
MSIYFQNFKDVLKKEFMLVIMVSVLLVFTFFLWAGIPVFIIGSFVSELTSNIAIIHFCISLSVGFLFSLFFVPINLKVARNIAKIKNRSVWISIVRIEIIWIIVCALIFAVIFNIVIQL